MIKEKLEFHITFQKHMCILTVIHFWLAPEATVLPVVRHIETILKLCDVISAKGSYSYRAPVREKAK